MARPAVDISMIGDKELERMLTKLPDVVQRRVATSAIMKAAKTAHGLMIQAVSGNPVGVDTGRLLMAIAAEKPVKQRRPTAVVYYISLPERIRLGIPPKGRWYYPTHVEYGYTRKDGTTVPPKSFLRKPIDTHRSALIKQMGDDIRKGVIRNMKRLAKT